MLDLTISNCNVDKFVFTFAMLFLTIFRSVDPFYATGLYLHPPEIIKKRLQDIKKENSYMKKVTQT